MANRNIVAVDDGVLTVRPRGLDRIWAFKQQVSVLLSGIAAVRVVPKTDVRRGLRMPGLDIGYKICGTFYRDGERNFWNYRGPEPMLDVELCSEQEFTHLYLTVADPDAVQREINEARERPEPHPG